MHKLIKINSNNNDNADINLYNDINDDACINLNMYT